MSGAGTPGAGWRHLWAIAGALLAVVLRAADYEHELSMAPGAATDIRLTVPGGRAPSGGFLPVRVRIANRAADAREWTLDLSMMMQGPGLSGQLHSDHRFVVPAGVTRDFFIFAPVPEGGDGRTGVMVNAVMDGPDVAAGGHFMFSLGYTWNSPVGSIAVEPALEQELRTFLGAKYPEVPTGAPTYGGHSPLGQALERISAMRPESWPADWRIWSSHSVVILADDTWERLDGARRQALLDWVALGGRLLLAPVGERLERPPLLHGAGRIVRLAQPVGRTKPELSESLGFHETRLAAPGDALASAQFWDLDAKKWQIGLQAGWLTLFVLTFGILVGPVNLFVFAPADRRHRLFFTVPALSLAASAVLVGVIIVGDGFGGAGARRTVVVLLPQQNQAAVFQRQVSRTGLLRQEGFAVPADVVISLEADPAMPYGKAVALRRDDDRASGDWFASRATQQHALRRLMASRERVELVSPGGAAPVVQSTVGATLREFTYKDAAGRLWQADAVPPGTRVTLRPWSGGGTGESVAPLAGAWAEGQFFARGGRSDTLPIPTLGSIRWSEEEDRVLYTGRLAGEAAP
ncbi:MAG TPA: hypothetical protein VEB66_11330 [Opitutaceae bacterium]|nr:hypothetical protein [Opitutaceae bacterium]